MAAWVTDAIGAGGATEAPVLAGACVLTLFFGVLAHRYVAGEIARDLREIEEARRLLAMDEPLA